MLEVGHLWHQVADKWMTMTGWMIANQVGLIGHTMITPTLNYANEFDLNLKGWLLQGENYKAGAVLGYQQTRFSWTASGGLNYDNGESIGGFPLGEEVVIVRNLRLHHEWRTIQLPRIWK